MEFYHIKFYHTKNGEEDMCLNFACCIQTQQQIQTIHLLHYLFICLLIKKYSCSGFVHVVVAVTWHRQCLTIRSRRGGDDIIISQNIRIGCTHENAWVCFQINTFWDPVYKNVRIRLDKTPLRYKMFTYTAKRVSMWTGPWSHRL